MPKCSEPATEYVRARIPSTPANSGGVQCAHANNLSAACKTISPARNGTLVAGSLGSLPVASTRLARRTTKSLLMPNTRPWTPRSFPRAWGWIPQPWGSFPKTWGILADIWGRGARDSSPILHVSLLSPVSWKHPPVLRGNPAETGRSMPQAWGIHPHPRGTSVRGRGRCPHPWGFAPHAWRTSPQVTGTSLHGWRKCPRAWGWEAGGWDSSFEARGEIGRKRFGSRPAWGFGGQVPPRPAQCSV